MTVPNSAKAAGVNGSGFSVMVDVGLMVGSGILSTGCLTWIDIQTGFRFQQSRRISYFRCEYSHVHGMALCRSRRDTLRGLMLDIRQDRVLIRV